MTRTLRVAVVGAGGWGRNLVRNFATLRGATLAWVCDLSDEALRETAATWPSTPCTRSYLEVVGDDRVEGVVVATNPSEHHAIARAALLAGKDVFVEKPLALDAERARDLCDIAERNARILMVGHVLLFHPAVVALHRLVRDGELGDLLYLHAQRLNLGVARRNENAWWALAPHDVALANYLFDAVPTEVALHGGGFLRGESDALDVAFATLRYPAGRMAHVHVSWLDPHKTRRMTVVGTRQMAVFDDASPDQKLTLFDRGAEPASFVSYEQGLSARSGEIRIPAVRLEEPLRLECEAFLHAMRTRQPPRSDGRSGLAVVGALEAGARSIRSGGGFVPVAGSR
jgi:predicted dehydrogenase